MAVEGGGPVPFHLEEEFVVGLATRLDEVLAYQETADNEARAGVDPVLWIRTIFVNLFPSRSATTDTAVGGIQHPPYPPTQLHHCHKVVVTK